MIERIRYIGPVMELSLLAGAVGGIALQVWRSRR